MTVVPPGPGSPAGLIASGKVGARRWSARVSLDKNGLRCVDIGAFVCGIDPHAFTLADLAGGGVDGAVVEFAPVQPPVTRVTVLLGDSQLLVLHPTRTLGGRWIVLPVPRGVPVNQVTAYAGRSEAGYQIPFNGGHGLPLPSLSFGLWLRPGTVPHARSTFLIGSGTVGAVSWTEHEYVGPWGTCFGGTLYGLEVCQDSFGPQVAPGHLVQAVTASPGDSNGPGLFLAAAAPSVARLTVTVSGGEVITPSLHRGYGAEGFFTYLVSKGHPLRWTAYDAAGKQLGTGNAGIGG